MDDAQVPTGGRLGARPLLSVWLPVVAVGLAFADASIVALALPAIYGEFDTTVVGVSWVLTGYALAVTAAGLVIAVIARRVRPVMLLAAGLVVFAVASVLCGLSTSLAVLIAGRCMQGVGAAALLAGALAVLAAARPDGRGRALWGSAAGLGLALGPALGGSLTTAFEWRSIFLVQAPIAAAALAVVTDPRARRLPPRSLGAPPATATSPTRTAPRLLPLLASMFLFAGLVGALFLSVLLIIEVWQFSPLSGAMVVTALPAAMLLARPLALRLPARLGAAGGVLLLSGGLTSLALLPAASAWWAGAALAICGTGLALVTRVLDQSGGSDANLVRDGSLSVAARHAGLVLGLLVIAPILAAALDQATETAIEAGTGVVLDEQADLEDKIRIAEAVAGELTEVPRGEVPDLEAIVADSGADAETAERVGHVLTGEVEDIFTRSFRRSFLVAAALAAVTISFLLFAPGRAAAARPGFRRPALAGLAALVLACGTMLLAEMAAGAGDYGRHRAADPCAARANPFPGSGFDAATQRIMLSAINGAGCELGISREQAVLLLVGYNGPNIPAVDDAEMEDSLRAGLVRAIDDAEERGDLAGWAARPLRALAESAPLSWLTDYLGVTVEHRGRPRGRPDPSNQTDAPVAGRSMSATRSTSGDPLHA